MKLVAIRAFYLGGSGVEVGAAVETNDRLARQMIACGKARPAEDAIPRRRAPMTTKTAPPIVRGAAEKGETNEP